MPKTINSIEAWDVGQQSKKNRLLASARWKNRHRASLPVPAAKPKAEGLAEGVETVTVIRAGGFEVECPRTYLAIDWFTDEQRAQLERVAVHDVGKPGEPGVAVCKLLGYDGTDAECEMSISGYEVPRASLPKWVLDAKKVKVGDKFHWIMRDAVYIKPDDIDTAVGPADPQLTADERKRLKDLRAEVLRERAVDDEAWEEYTGPGQ